MKLITDIKVLWNVFKNLSDEKQYIFYLDDNELKGYNISSNQNECGGEMNLAYLRSIIPAIQDKSIMIVHNHTNEKPNPSISDHMQHKLLTAVFELLHIHFEDYVIVSPYGYFSFLENGLHRFIANFEEKKYTTKIPSSPLGEKKSISAPFSLNRSDDVLKHRECLVKLLNEHGDFLIQGDQLIFANGFSPFDFLELDYNQGSIYFTNGTDLNILRNISVISNFTEIYFNKNNNLISLFTEV